MPFKIIRNDITKMTVDAIVNTANEAPAYGDGLDTAVYEAAGKEQLLAARRAIGVLQEGDAAITPGFNLPAKYIIHAASPFYMDGTRGEEEKLRSCYRKSFALAAEHGCESVAVPLIATGSFGYPKAAGMEIALNEIHRFLLNSDMMIYLVVFDKEAVRLSGQIFHEVESYIDEHYVEEKATFEYGGWIPEFVKAERPKSRREASVPESWDEEDEDSQEITVSVPAPERTSRLQRKETAPKVPKLQSKTSAPQMRSLEELMANAGETFSQRLLRLIDERGLKDSEVYKKAGKTKQNFHKIRVNPQYQPSKQTVFAFALALELSLDETKDLLASAGFAFSPASKFDLIVQYALERGIYDIYKVDLILYDFGLEKYYFSCEKD